MGQFSTTFTSTFDVSNILSGVNKIQQALFKLKIPSELQSSLKKSFDGIDSEVSKIQTALKSGFKTQGDVTSLAKSFKQVETYINKIQTQTMKINPNLIPEGWSYSASTEIQKVVDDLTKAREKVANFWTDFSKTPIDNKFADQFKTLGDAVTDFQNKAKDLKGGTKTSQLFKGLSSALESGEVEKIKTALDSITTKYTNFITKFKDKGGDWQVLSSLQTSFNAIKASLNEGNFKQLEEQVETLRSHLASLSEQDYSKLNTSLSQLATYVNSGAKGSIGLAEEMHKTNAEIDQFQSRIKYFFGLNNTINLIKRSITSAFNTVKELDKAMVETAVVTNYTVEDMWGRLPEYTKMANKLGATTLGAYQTATLYYQQGLKTNEVMAISEQTMKMARIGGLEYAEATDMMTAALRGFKMQIDEVSATRVNDVYSKLAAITAADTEEIATAMTKTASIADSANMSFETTSAFLSQIIETTREAPETAGTAMKTIIARFAEVKKLIGKGSLLGEDEEGSVIDVNKIDTALKTVGLSLSKFITGEEGLDDVLLRLAEKWDTLDLSTQRYIATQAAGSRQQSRFLAMMSDYDRTMELVNAAHNSAGASEEQFNKTLDSAESKLNNLSNAWDRFTMGIANPTMLKGVIGILTGILEVVNTLTGAFGDFGGSIAKIGLLAGGLKLAGTLFGAIGGGYNTLKSGEGFGKGFKTTLKGQKENGFLGQVVSGVKSKLSKGPQYDFSTDFTEFGEKIGEDDLKIIDNKREKLFNEYANKMAESDINLKDYENEDGTMDILGYDNFKTDFDEKKQKYKKDLSEKTAQEQKQALEAQGFSTDIDSETKSSVADRKKAGAAMAAAAAVQALAVGMNIYNSALQKNKEATDGTKEGFQSITQVVSVTAAALSAIIPILISIGAAGMAALGPVIGIIAGLAVVIGGIMLIAQAIETPAEKTERLAKQTEEATQAAADAQSAYDDLLSGKSAHNDLLNELNKLTEGTQEFKNKLLEANSAALDLMNKYPEFINGMQTDERGAITFNDEAWDGLIEGQQEKVKKTQQAVISSKLTEEQNNFDLIKEENKAKNFEFLTGRSYDSGSSLSYGAMALDSIEKENRKVFEDYQAAEAQARRTLTDDEILGIKKESRYSGLTANEFKEKNNEYNKLLKENENAENASLLKQQTLASQLYQSEAQNRGYDSETAKMLSDVAAETIDEENLTAVRDAEVKKYEKIGKDDGISKLQEEYEDMVGPITGAMGEWTISDYADRIADVTSVKSLMGEGSNFEATLEAFDQMDTATKDLITDNKDLAGVDIAENYKAAADRISHNNKLTNEQKEIQLELLEKTKKNSEKQWAEAAGGAKAALEQYTNIGEVMVKGLSTGQLNKVTEVASGFGRLFGKESGTIASKEMFDSFAEDSEISDILSGLNFNNSIDTLDQLKKKTQQYSGETQTKLQGVFDEAQKGIGEDGLLGALTQSEDFTQIQESLNDFIDSNDEITSDNIRDLAKDSQMLEKYLNVSSISAGTLAEILTEIQISDTGIEQFTDSLIKALDAANRLGNAIDEAFDFIDNKEWARSEQDVDKFLQETANGLADIMANGGYADSGLKDRWSTLFGTDSLKAYEQALRDYEGKSEDLGAYLEGLFGPEMDAIRGLSESGSAEALWDYWNTVAEAQGKGQKKVSDIITKDENGFYQLANKDIQSTEQLIQELMEIPGMTEDMASMLVTSAVATSQSLRDALSSGDMADGFASFAQDLDAGGVLLQSDLQIFADKFGIRIDEVMAGIEAQGYTTSNGLISNLRAGWAKNAKEGLKAIKDDVLGGMEGVLGDSLKTYSYEDIFSSSSSQGAKYKEGMEGYKIGDTEIDVDEAINNLKRLGASEQEAQDILDEYVSGTETKLTKMAKHWDKASQFMVESAEPKLDTENWDQYYARVNEISRQAMVQEQQNVISEGIKGALKSMGEEGVDVELTSKVTFEKDSTAVDNYDPPNLSRTVTYTVQEANGTFANGAFAGGSFASGNAFERGTAGTGMGRQDALVGELGSEIVVDPHSGRWHTVGDNGAEFTKLPKNAIVFNHLQTKGLLQNRRIFGRGKALASGNAFPGGNAYGFYGDGYDPRTGATKKNSSGGGKKKGGKDEWENELDQQYNTLKRIEKIERDREKLEEELERIYEKGAALDNLRQQEAILDEIIDKQTKLIDMRKQELEELMKENKEWKDYAYFDPQLGQLIIDWEKIDALKGDKGEEFDKYFDDLEEFYDRLVDAEDGQADAINDLYDLIDEQRDQYLSIEERVMDAVLTEAQQVIDRLSGINEAINDSNARLLESMQKSIDDERQLRENEDTEKEIADKQARLDLLSRDTSGTYATEIKELTKEIADMQEDYTDTLVDQAIQNLQDQYDLAADERERNIELLQNQKDFKEENGKYWDLALKMLSGNEADLEAYLMMYDEEYKKASPEDQLKMLEEMKNEYATGMAWYYEHGQNNIGKNEDGSINGYTGEGDADKEKAGKQTYKEEITGETKFEKENDKSVEYKKVNKTIITQYYNPDGTEGLVEEELKEEWVPTGNVYDVVVNDPTSGGSSNSGGYIVNGKRYTYLSQAMAASGNYNGEKNLTLSQANNIVARKIDDKKIPEKVKDKKIKKATITRAHAKGGLADYTGPGWLDGTLSKPELVLNPNETQDFLEFVKIFRSLGNIEVPSQNNGENHFDIHIEIDSMGSDYDVDQMVDRVVHKIGEKASYRNVNVITNFRR